MLHNRRHFRNSQVAPTCKYQNEHLFMAEGKGNASRPEPLHQADNAQVAKGKHSCRVVSERRAEAFQSQPPLCASHSNSAFNVSPGGCIFGVSRYIKTTTKISDFLIKEMGIIQFLADLPYPPNLNESKNAQNNILFTMFALSLI